MVPQKNKKRPEAVLRGWAITIWGGPAASSPRGRGEAHRGSGARGGRGGLGGVGACPFPVAGLSGGGKGHRVATDGRPVAGATISPLADLVQSVAGTGWTVRTVIPPGTSPHIFEPEPSDLRKLVGGKVVGVAGAGYDDWMRRVLAACASGAKVLDTAASLGIGPEAPGGQEHEEDGDHEGHDHAAEKAPGGEESPGKEGHEGHAHGVLGEEPHWWLPPELAARNPSPLKKNYAPDKGHSGNRGGGPSTQQKQRQ